MNHSEICHKFMNRIENKRTKSIDWKSNNIYCYNKSIYSYGSHYCLAFFAEYKKKKILFVNTYSHSNSTSKHQSHIRQAINYNIVDSVIFCDFRDTLGSNGTDELTGKTTEKKKILKQYAKTEIKEITENYNSSFRAKKYFHTTKYIKDSFSTIQNFIDRYKLNIIIPELNYEKLENHINERKKIINKREKEQTRKQQIFDYKNRCNNKFEYNHPFASLEIKEDRIKTSNYNQVSISQFKLAFVLFYTTVTKRKSFFNKDMKIGSYQGINIKKNGMVKIGCTRFYPDDIIRIGKVLNLNV